MDEEQIEIKEKLGDEQKMLKIKDEPNDQGFILSPIENPNLRNCDKITERAGLNKSGVKEPETCEYSQRDSENSKIVFPCCICFKVFLTKKDRKEHSLSSHVTQILENQETPTDSNSSENKENLLCSICSIMFTNKYDLDSHMINIHQSKTLENFKCYICLKVYQTREDINKHFIGDHPGKELEIQETGKKLSDQNSRNSQKIHDTWIKIMTFVFIFQVHNGRRPNRDKE